jgi:hypothetical protein
VAPTFKRHFTAPGPSEVAMSAYVVGDIHITDPAAYRAHVPVALATTPALAVA